jgi:carbon storage regulator
MLALSRREGEVILIGDDIRVEIAQVAWGRVKVRIEAPDDVLILREEILEREYDEAS